MVVLRCNSVTKSFGIDTILRDITFFINDKDKIGLVGGNGEGKTTLFKILSGNMQRDSGEIFIDKFKTIGYLSQESTLNSNNNILEEATSVFSGLLLMEKSMKELEEEMQKPYDKSNEEYHNRVIHEYTSIHEKYSSEGGYLYKSEVLKVLKGLEFNEIDFEKKVSLLSGGEKTRLSLCKLLLEKPDILLLDEPTNHLDLSAIEWLEDYLKNYSKTLFIISHDRFFLDKIVTGIFEIKLGKIETYIGNYSTYIVRKKEKYEQELKAYSLQQDEIKRQEEIIARYRRFNREKSIKAAMSREKALSRIERLEKPKGENLKIKLKFEVNLESGNDVLKIENLSKSFKDKLLFENLSLEVKKGEKIAFIGKNGIGKTTFFKIIMGKVKQNEGNVILGRNVEISYYDQEQADLNLDKAVIDEIWDDFPYLTVTEIRTLLGRFLFKGDDVFKEIRYLSGGEKCRINLLKLFLSKSNLLLLDEPTNHLDIPSREVLEDALSDYEGTLLVISHDRYFLNKVIEKICEFEKNSLTAYLGNYSYYLEKKTKPTRFLKEETPNYISKTLNETEKKKKREELKKEKEIKQRLLDIENKINEDEEEIGNLNDELCKEEVFSNHEKSYEISLKIKKLQDEVDDLYEEWVNY